MFSTRLLKAVVDDDEGSMSIYLLTFWETYLVVRPLYDLYENLFL